MKSWLWAETFSFKHTKYIVGYGTISKHIDDTGTKKIMMFQTKHCLNAQLNLKEYMFRKIVETNFYFTCRHRPKLKVQYSEKKKHNFLIPWNYPLLHIKFETC